jgi:hypothetical protein
MFNAISQHNLKFRTARKIPGQVCKAYEITGGAVFPPESILDETIHCSPLPFISDTDIIGGECEPTTNVATPEDSVIGRYINEPKR